jgi:hypothetical protein
MYNFWDKDSKQRVWKPAQKANTGITATAFNRSGNILAYAVGYDWSKVRTAPRVARPSRYAGALTWVAADTHTWQGLEGYSPAYKTAIMLKQVTDEQIRVKPKK